MTRLPELLHFPVYTRLHLAALVDNHCLRTFRTVLPIARLAKTSVCVIQSALFALTKQIFLHTTPHWTSLT